MNVEDSTRAESEHQRQHWWLLYLPVVDAKQSADCLVPAAPDESRLRQCLLAVERLLAVMLSTIQSEQQQQHLMIVLSHPVLAQMHSRGLRTESWRSLEYLLNLFYTSAHEFIKLSRRAGSNPTVEPTVSIVVELACGYDPFNRFSQAPIYLIQVDHQEQLCKIFRHRIRHVDQDIPAVPPQSIVNSDLFSFKRFSSFDRHSKIRVEIPPLESVDGDTSLPSSHETVVLGGTFDHFHAGHKILLTMACWLSTKRVACGVTSDALLLNKKHRHLLEPIEVRMKSVREFICLSASQLEPIVVVINDIYGPTATDPSFEAIVVSEESLNGGRAVNAKRFENKLRPLYIYVIDIISAGLKPRAGAAVSSAEGKLGSTDIRELIQVSTNNSSAQLSRTSSVSNLSQINLN